MKRFKALIRKFFSLSRGETNGFLILVPLMALILFSEPIFRVLSSGEESQSSNDEKKLDSLIARWEWETGKIDSIKPIPVRNFLFNPNHVSKDELVALGFSSSLSQRILNYRAKGGAFKIKSDLKKIYGMNAAFYDRLFPFIDLPEQLVSPSFVEGKTEKILPAIPAQFDINLADSTQLKKIYGIGNVLSARIIAYRERLGGFVSLHQLREVYGLDSAVLKQLNEKIYISKDFKPLAIVVNEATEKELALHPYIKSRLAKAITAYRFQHGRFNTIEDLQKIALINDETFGRIKPYLVLNN